MLAVAVVLVAVASSWQAAVQSFRRMSEQPVAHAIAATVITVAALWNHPNHSRGLAHLPAVPNCDYLMEHRPVNCDYAMEHRPVTGFANLFGEHTARLRGVDRLQTVILEEEDRHALVTPSPNASVLLGRCQDAAHDATFTFPPSMPVDVAIAGGIEAARTMRRRHEALHHRLATRLQDREMQATRNWHRCRVRMTERLKLEAEKLADLEHLLSAQANATAAAAREQWAAERVALEKKREDEVAEAKRKVQTELAGALGKHSTDLHKILADQETVIVERDAAIAERDKVIAERDAAIAERGKVIVERDQLRIAANRAEAALAASASAPAKMSDATSTTPTEQKTIPSSPLPPSPPRMAEECPPLSWLLMASTGTVLCAAALITGRRMRMLVLAEAKARAECLQLEASSAHKDQDVWGELATRRKAAEQISSLRQRAIDDAASRQPGEPLSEASLSSLGDASTAEALQVGPRALTLHLTLLLP